MKWLGRPARRTAATALAAMFWVACSIPAAHAAPPFPNLKTLKSPSYLEASPYSPNFAGTFNSILESSVDSNLYDPLTIATLKRLREDAQPFYNPRDVDPDRTRRIGEKALAIQSGRSLAEVLDHSELQPVFFSIKQEMEGIKRLFGFSLQNVGHGYAVSRDPRGKKLVEFGIEFNLKRGIDPQIRLGEKFRLRYDFVDQRPIFEFATNF